MVVLPAPLGPSRAKHRAPRHGQVDPVQHHLRAETHPQVADPDGVHRAPLIRRAVCVCGKLFIPYTLRMAYAMTTMNGVDEDIPPISRGIALAWGIAEAPQRGPKREMSIERIVEAAMEIADADGITAVSMGGWRPVSGSSPCRSTAM